MKPYGKLVDCPCGGIAEMVVGQFAVCQVKGCDGRQRCAGCGSSDLKPYSSEIVPEGSYSCVTCGKIRWKP